MYLESFPYGFRETCEIPQQLTDEKITLRLPEVEGYEIVAHKEPCIVSTNIIFPA